MRTRCWRHTRNSIENSFEDGTVGARRCRSEGKREDRLRADGDEGEHAEDGRGEERVSTVGVRQVSGAGKMRGDTKTIPRARGRGLHARSGPALGTRRTVDVLQERRETLGALVYRGLRGDMDEAARRSERSDAPVEYFT